MWTALAIVVITLAIVWYAIRKANKQGQTEKQNEYVQAHLDAIKRANKAKSDLNPNGMHNDPNNRDTL